MDDKIDSSVGDLVVSQNNVEHVWSCIYGSLSLGLLIILLIEPSYGSFSIRTYCVLNLLVFTFSFLFNNYILKLNILSLPQVFLLVTFLYTSGLLTLFAFGLADLYLMVTWYDEYYAAIAIKMIMMSIFALQFGVCLAAFHKYSNQNIQEVCIGEKFSDDLFKLGVIGFFVSISILIISTILGSGYSEMFQSGYTDFKATLKGSDVRFFLTALSILLPVSVIIMASGAKTDKQIKLIYIVSFISLVAFLLAGDRGGAFSLLIALVFTLTLIGKKYSYAKIIIGAIIVLILVPTIKDLRRQPFSEVVAEGISLVSEKSPFYRAFSETGASFQTFLGTIIIIPEIENYRYGDTYVEALSKIIPNLGAWKLREDSGSLTSWITSYMNPYGKSGLGFLQIAEFYVQFGVVGIFLGFFMIGYFLTKWQIKCEIGLSDRRWVAINGCILCFLLIWIRNDIFNFIRPAVWSAILIFGWTFFAKDKHSYDKRNI